VSTGAIAVITDAAVTLDTPIHFVIHEWTEVLIAKCSLVELVATILVTRHHRHVLKVAFAAFIAHRTIVGMIQHHSFNDAGSKCGCFRIRNRNACSVGRRGHARHHNLPLLVVFILELFDRALTARSDRAKYGMPTEVGKV